MVKEIKERRIAISVFGAAAFVMLGVIGTAFAQPQNNNNNFPQCPAGTTSFHRGYCESEPTSFKCPATDENGNRVERIGTQCFLVEAITPDCPEGEYYDIFTDSCLIGFTKTPTGSMPNCDGLPAGFDLIRFDGVWRCVRFTYYSEATPECSTGTFDAESEKCIVRPGQGNNR